MVHFLDPLGIHSHGKWTEITEFGFKMEFNILCYILISAHQSPRVPQWRRGQVLLARKKLKEVLL